MVKATFSVLSEADKQLVLETELKKLKKLDEDELIALHARVRRARNKHTKLYRQGAASHVKAKGARGSASKSHARARARAEVIEDALARVSRRLAAEARRSADALKAERLEAARKGKPKGKGGSASGTRASSTKPTGSAKAKKARRQPASERARASTKSTGKRRQPKRDNR